MSLDRLIGLVPAQVTEEAGEVMRLSMLDWLACGLAGRDEPVARALRDLALGEGGAAQAGLIGGGRAPLRAAALVNGAASHALDYDDTHFDHIGHPSVAIVPAALAAGEAHAATLAQVVEAALAGCELSVRLGLRLGRGHYQIGYHQTATAGAFGAAFAAVRLLGAPVKPALSLVSTRAAGLKSQFGTMGKPYNAGIAASNGIEAALLAPSFDAPADPLGGTNGFFATHHADGTWNQPQGWRMTDVSHKFHACCHGLHATLEALSDLAPHDPATVNQVTVTTHPRWMTVCNIATPQSGLEAKFSYAQVVALALMGHDTAALGTYSDVLARDPGVAALRDRVAVTTDDHLAETEARVTLSTASGTKTAAHDLAAPRPLAQRRDRVLAKSRALIGPDLTQRAWTLLQDPQAPASAFAALLSETP